MAPQSKKTLRYHWVAGGIASSLSRFIPLPIVDGFIDEHAKRYSLDRTLDYHKRKFQASDVKPLYKDSESIPGWVASKLRQIALFPVRKVAKYVTASTGIPKDFAHTYLLARTVDLCLTNDFLLDSSSSKNRMKEAQNIRDAFDSAFGKLDEMLFKTTTRIVRREFSEMGPEVSAALAKIVGRPLKAKASPGTGKRDGSASKAASSNPEDDAAFSKLVSDFEDLFRKEMGERGLNGLS
jgi:hypothetical protein